ncbi:MAG: hypothetical protein E3J89_04925 [Candidatus Aminicenantes bacterium]|nr:MAG: hypothetical protein E3J89_04925 [Candidatus Aminicenantes bacterium]
MAEKGKFLVVKIRKSTWLIWGLRVIWIFWLLFWAEFTVGSWKELERRAFVISLVILLVSLFVGSLLWLWGYIRFKKVS